MSEDVAKTITEAAAEARSVLGQLGPLAWALHAGRQPIGALAVCLYRNPGEYAEIRDTEETPERRKQRKQRVVGVLRDLRCNSPRHTGDRFESTGYRETVNRSVVVYAAAVLEQFMDRAGGGLWEACGGQETRCDKCRRKSGWPADTLNKVSRLMGTPTKVDLRGEKSYIGAAWLVLVRNAVIHNRGLAIRAGNDARNYSLDPDHEGNNAHRWRPDAGPRGEPVLVWDDKKGQAPTDDWKGRTFSISIDHFILPRLRDAQAFVEEAACVLRQRAQQLGSGLKGGDHGRCA